jgi:hypothetical protein
LSLVACTPRQTPTTHEPKQDETTARSDARDERGRPARASKRAWGRPEITQAKLTSPTEVTLHFSEPVVPTAGFDPAQFRLSAGAHYSYPGYSATYYYDVGDVSDDGGPAAFRRIDTLDDTTLRLVLATPLAEDACELDEIDDPDEGASAVAGIFLHFDRRDDEGIVDRDGNHLKDIAEAWVLRGAEEATYYGAQSHRIRALGPIPCAFTPALPPRPTP